MKKIIAALSAVVLASTLCVCVGAYDNVYVYDDAALYSESEIESLSAYFDKVYQESGLLCVLVSQNYAIDNMLDLLPDYAGGAIDMSLLDIDMGNRRFDHYQYNSVSGESAFRMNNTETDDILDTVLNYMADGDYVGAGEVFAKLSQEYFTNDDNFAPGTDGYGGQGYTEYYNDYSDYDGEYGDGYYSEEASVSDYFLISLAVGAIAGLITVLIVFASYKTKLRGEVYPLDKYSNLELTDRKDNFLRKSVVVTVIQDNNNSNHSGGSFGGGGFSGGGGHSGGRSF